MLPLNKEQEATLGLELAAFAIAVTMLHQATPTSILSTMTGDPLRATLQRFAGV